MTGEEFEKSADLLLKDCLAIIRDTKGKDYSQGQDPGVPFDRLANFKTVGDDTGLAPLQVWQAWTGKHWDAINRAIKANPHRPTKKGEPLRENFKDLIVYALLGNALIEETDQEK